MKSIYPLLLLLFISCSGKKESAELDIPESFSFMLKQRESRVIEGSEDDLKVKIGDITGGKVEVKISGITEENEEGEIYLDKVMTEGDRESFDYHGTSYTLEMEDLINKLIGDDHAQIAIYEGRPNNDFQPVVN